MVIKKSPKFLLLTPPPHTRTSNNLVKFEYRNLKHKKSRIFFIIIKMMHVIKLIGSIIYLSLNYSNVNYYIQMLHIDATLYSA